MSKQKPAIIALLSLLLILTACSNDSISTPAPTEAPVPMGPTTTRTEEPIILRLELTGEVWDEKFIKGLSGRTSLDGGMLFDFKDTVSNAFQMEQTLIPLSIAFISEELRIVDILDMKPLSRERYKPSTYYRYAIEVNQGFFSRNHIAVGTRVEFRPSPIDGYIDIVFFR